VRDGRRFLDRVGRYSMKKPLVVLKGGATALGQTAASSHTGSLASDDRVFDGISRQLGMVRAESLEEAYEATATFATQPLPRGKRVLVFTAAGGWGVLCADACVRAGLEVVALPDDLRAEIDALLPSRWSRNNPVDMAGGESRDTIPTLLDLVTRHPAVDAVDLSGPGHPGANAGVLKSGEFYPGYASTASSRFTSDRMLATPKSRRSERAVRQAGALGERARHHRPRRDEPRAAHGRGGGRLLYPSAHRAVRALAHLVRYAEWRRRRS